MRLVAPLQKMRAVGGRCGGREGERSPPKRGKKSTTTQTEEWSRSTHSKPKPKPYTTPKLHTDPHNPTTPRHATAKCSSAQHTTAQHSKPHHHQPAIPPTRASKETASIACARFVTRFLLGANVAAIKQRSGPSHAFHLKRNSLWVGISDSLGNHHELQRHIRIQSRSEGFACGEVLSRLTDPCVARFTTQTTPFVQVLFLTSRTSRQATPAINSPNFRATPP